MARRQKLDISSIQSQFSRSKINLILLKTIFLSEYQINRTTFITIAILSLCLQNIKISFEYVGFYAKSYYFLHPHLKTAQVSLPHCTEGSSVFFHKCFLMSYQE